MNLNDTFLNGYTFAFCEKSNFTKGQGWRWALEEMARTTGCNTVILPVCAWQEHPWSTVMFSDTSFFIYEVIYMKSYSYKENI